MTQLLGLVWTGRGACAEFRRRIEGSKRTLWLLMVAIAGGGCKGVGGVGRDIDLGGLYAV